LKKVLNTKVLTSRLTGGDQLIFFIRRNSSFL